MYTLFRLIHVSDFHLGDDLYPQTSPSAASGYLTARNPQFETHDLAVLEALSNSVTRAHQTSRVPVKVLITGDLTALASKQASELAFDYMNHSIGLVGGMHIGFNQAEALVVPGNHDVWGKQAGNTHSGVNPIPPTRAEFDQRFNLPASLASHPQSGNKFPYRIELHRSPLIYFYGLDSARVDAYTGNQTNSLLSDGYVDSQQLSDLEELVKGEPAPPRLRIAALHHALMRPLAGSAPYTKGNLLNLDEILTKLTQLKFTLAPVRPLTRRHPRAGELEYPD